MVNTWVEAPEDLTEENSPHFQDWIFPYGDKVEIYSFGSHNIVDMDNVTGQYREYEETTLIDMPMAELEAWSAYNPEDDRIFYDDFWDSKKNTLVDNWMTAKAIREFKPDAQMDADSLEWKLGETREWMVMFGTGKTENVYDAKIWISTGTMELILTDSAMIGMSVAASAIASIALF